MIRSLRCALINLGREKCVETYSRYFETATPKQIEFFYAFVSAGCIGLPEMAGGGHGNKRREISGNG